MVQCYSVTERSLSNQVIYVNSELDFLRCCISDEVTIYLRLLSCPSLSSGTVAEMVRDLLAFIPATIKSEPPILSGSRPFLPDLGAEADLTPLHLAAHEGNEGVVRILLNIPGVQADGTSRLNVRLARQHASLQVEMSTRK